MEDKVIRDIMLNDDKIREMYLSTNVKILEDRLKHNKEKEKREKFEEMNPKEKELVLLNEEIEQRKKNDENQSRKNKNMNRKDKLQYKQKLNKIYKSVKKWSKIEENQKKMRTLLYLDNKEEYKNYRDILETPMIKSKRYPPGKAQAEPQLLLCDDFPDFPDDLEDQLLALAVLKSEIK